MSTRTTESAVADILYKRYSDLLKDVDIAAVVAYLVEQNLISSGDKEGVLKHRTPFNQQRKLSRILTAQGSARMMLNIQAITAFKEGGQSSERIGQDDQETGKTEKPSMHEGKEKNLWSESQGGKHLVSVDDSAIDRRRPESSRTHVIGKKHQMNDVPDPPTTADVDVVNKQMEAFVVLFFTFVCQHIQTLQKSAASAFTWLQSDSNLEQIQEYFPPHIIHGIQPNIKNPVQLRLSVLLNAFQQFVTKFEALICENKSLESRAKLLQDLVERSTKLEDEIQEYRRRESQMGTRGASRTHDKTQEQFRQRLEKEQAELRSKLDALKAKVLEIEPLKRALARSEERNKQLVGVTQQWAIECQEKDAHIAGLETQVQQFKQERELFKKKLVKYKKQASVERGQKVSDTQFEELREELGYRRELHDKVVMERDEAVEQVKLLKEEISLLRRQVEEDKDEVEELKDRVGNFKVQMQGREPTVREFGLVLQENRQLKEENEQLMKDNSTLKDEVLACKEHIKEITQTTNGRVDDDQSRAEERRQTSPPARQHQQPATKLPVKTQAMVTGYSILRRSQSPPTSGTITNGVTHSNEELQSDSTTVESDTTHNSFVPKLQTKPSSAPNRRSPTPPTTTHRPQANSNLGASDQHTSSVVGYLATNTIPNGHATPGEVQLQNGLSSIASSHHDGDYTAHTRYPNRSGILVQPLHNDDLSILQQEGVFNRGSTSPPNFYDATPLLPTKTTPPSLTPPLSPAAAKPPNQPVAKIITPGGLGSPPLSFSSNERKCPVCQHVFLTLGEREFQSHVAGCFK